MYPPPAGITTDTVTQANRRYMREEDDSLAYSESKRASARKLERNRRDARYTRPTPA
jgi:hypothetical protein